MTLWLTVFLFGSLCVVYARAVETTAGNANGPPVEPFNVKEFPLRKCHCGADKFWENETCKRAPTSVEYLTSFHPQRSVHILTKDIEELFVSDVVCKDGTPVRVNNVVFSGGHVLFHRESGDSFQKYCVEHVKNNNNDIITIAVVCVPQLSLPVCCPEGHSINATNYECNKHKNVTIKPPIHIGSGDSVLPETKISPYLQKVPRCERADVQKKPLRTDDTGRKASLHYQRSNVLFLETDVSEGPFLVGMKFPSDFCVSAEIGTDSYSAYIWDEWADELCRNSSRSESFQGTDDRCDRMMYWTVLPLLVLSSICLLAILILHAMLPELTKSIGSKITLAHVASLLAGFCVLLLLHLPIDFNCKIYGPMVQGFFLATFFWLNVMCFDLWWKLRCRSPAGDDAQHTKSRFVKYSVYAWGSPLLIVIVTVAMDNVEQLRNHPFIIVPGFGKSSCWFADRSATMAYYFSIIAALMAVNLFLFVWVFVILVRANYTYNQVLRVDVTRPSRTWIYLKIFGVMGITWIFEFFSWHEGTCAYWILTDIINSLRGLVLFIIFFGNKKSFRKIKIRFSDMNVRFHSSLSNSMSSLRKLSLKPTSTAESNLETM